MMSNIFLNLKLFQYYIKTHFQTSFLALKGKLPLFHYIIFIKLGLFCYINFRKLPLFCYKVLLYLHFAK